MKNIDDLALILYTLLLKMDFNNLFRIKFGKMKHTRVNAV